MVEGLEEIRQANDKPTACLIFLHGAVRNGKFEKQKFLKLLGDKATFKHIKVVFPTSPVKYFNLFGKVTNCWFNTEEENGRMKTSLEEINNSVLLLKDIVDEQQKYGIPPNRIVIGGESQGGMISLHAAYRFFTDLAGCVAVSACLPEQHTVYNAAKESEKRPPLLMLHSKKDDIIPFNWGHIAYERLKAVGVPAEFHDFEEYPHEMVLEELQIIYKWLETILPEA